MYCKNCGKQIKDDAMLCPYCGTPMNSNSPQQNIPRKKKKSKWWIPLIPIFCVTIVLCIVISSIGSSYNPENSNTTESSKETYSIGESAMIKTSNGDYSVKVTNVKETKERNEYANVNPKHVIIVTYEYTNISYFADVTVSFLYFRVYDSSNNLMEQYPYLPDLKQPSNIGKGKTHTAQVAYEITTDNKTAQLDLYDPLMSNVATFDLKW